MQTPSAPLHRPGSNQSNVEATRPLSRLRTALMQVTVGSRPFHANLTALRAGAQRLLNRGPLS